MANIKELIQSIESGDSSFDEKLAAINQMEETLVAMKEHEAIDDNVELIIEALRTIEAKVEAKLKIIPEKGEQGIQGAKGEQGDRGLDGDQGKDGKSGVDGKDGLDGKDGVSVQDAKIDFDGSLVITLSDGREINVGEVVPVDVAQTIHKIQSGSGGDSQTTLNAIAALQATIATYGTMATQNANAVAITGGTINNTTVGATTPSTGVFTTLTATGQTSLGGVAGAEGLRVVPVTSSTRYLTAQGSTADEVYLTASGPSGSNVALALSSRSTGAVRFLTNTNNQEQMRVSHTASAVNYHQLTGSATGSGPIHSVAGSDTNIDLNLTTKGTGAVRFNTGNGEQVRIVNSTTSDYWVMQGSPTILYPDGTSANRNAALSSKGTSAVQLYTNGGNQLQVNVAHTASAVNYVQVTGAVTGGRVTISAQGSDANVPVVIGTKGSGSLNVRTNDSVTTQFAVTSTASAVNYINVTGGVASSAPTISALGTDTNIPLVLQPKGTGALQAQQTDSTATGGNARGANAVDWQTKRSAATQVASGLGSVICGGEERNTASGQQSFVGTGYNNNSSTYGATIVSGVNNSNAGLAAFIGAGSSHTIGSNGAYSVLVGGNTNTSSGRYNFVGGGTLNSGTSGSTVTSQATTAVTSGSTAVTLSASNASIKVGQLINGTGIIENTYVAAISSTSLTLSQNATATGTPTLSFFTPHGVVVGGGNNQATGSYSFIGGGGDAGTASNRNVASGAWSVVVGGWKNTASGIASFVGGGGNYDGTTVFPNTASGNSSVVVGGINNTSSALNSFIGGGYNNIANSSQSVVIGGVGGTTRGIVANHVFAASSNPISGSIGVSQAALLVIGRETTNATATVLTSDNGSAGTSNQVILPNNSAYYFKVEIIANVTGGGNTSGWELKGVIKRGANAASTTIVGSVTSTLIAQDAGASTWAVSATADTTNGGLKITCTGQASTTIRWVAKASTTEVTF